VTGREGKTAYLKGWDERHAYSVCLTEAYRAGMVRMAFRTVDPEDLDYYEKRLQDFGVKYEVIPKTTAAAVRCVLCAVWAHR